VRGTRNAAAGTRADGNELYEGNDLKEQSMPDLCHKAWKLAVITIEEDRNLNLLARSKMFSSPDERWRAAGRSFTKTERP
jgi:hypothetical protein